MREIIREMGQSESTGARSLLGVVTNFAILSVLVSGCNPQLADENQVRFLQKPFVNEELVQAVNEMLIEV